MDLSNFYSEAPKRQIGICIFNRATYARCKVLVDELTKYPNVELTLFLSSSLLWEKFGKAADYIEREHPRAKVVRVPVAPVPGTHAGAAYLAGQISTALPRFLIDASLDAIVLVADRIETLPAAIAAVYAGIPVIHLQGGEVTGCLDDKIRNAVSLLADYHFCCTRLSREYLIQMGQDPKTVFHTGCPSIDLIRRNRVKRTYPKERYILSIFHPETENASDAYEQTKTVLEAVLDYCREHQHRCYWYYPNPDPGREEIIRYLDQSLSEWSSVFIRAVNQEPEDFLTQLGGARLVVGNSSCGIRECSYLGIPAVNVGSRQRLRERHFNVVDVGYDQAAILRVLREQHRIGRYPKSQLFGSGNASESIARYLQHIDFSLKGPVTYPTWEKFRESHFGEDRFYEHRARARTTVGNRSRLQTRSTDESERDEQETAS